MYGQQQPTVGQTWSFKQWRSGMHSHRQYVVLDKAEAFIRDVLSPYAFEYDKRLFYWRERSVDVDSGASKVSTEQPD